ncbi:hypothetical protein FOL47_005886 [Perkinsus chesapeaki]|uniref:CCAAT-binding factor domain-containing protein n=1 Tax=Perkinsus chesapeaki TaxID=330153 RepID=A0A7J6LW08_PERCH|nr:hypothetical protein FOL47_005886 [Perkinsus chesapeaki]
MVGGNNKSKGKPKGTGPIKPTFKAAKMNAKGGKGRWSNPAMRAAKRRQQKQQLANLPPEEAKERKKMEKAAANHHQPKPKQEDIRIETHTETVEPADIKSLAGCKWFNIAVPKRAQRTAKESSIDLDALHLEAEELYNSTVARFESLMKKDSEQAWLRKTVKVGTLSDKVTALVTMSQFCPALALPQLKALIGMCGKKAAREAQLGIDAVKELMVTEFLLKDRKLKSWSQQRSDLSNLPTKPHDRRLALVRAYFESELQILVAAFVQILHREIVLGGTVDGSQQHLRKKCLSVAYELLHARREQEPALRAMLVSGLTTKDSNEAERLLHKLLREQPRLKTDVAKEVIDQLIEKGSAELQDRRAMNNLYRGCAFLCSMRLTHTEDGDVAVLIAETFAKLLERMLSDDMQGPSKAVRPAHRGSRIHKRKKKGGDGPNQEDVQQRLRIVRLCLSGMHKAFTVANDSLVEARLSDEAMNAILRLSYSRGTDVPPAASNAAVMLLIEIARAQSKNGGFSTDEENEMEGRCWRAIYHHVHSLESQSASNYIPLLQMVWDLMEAKSTKPILAAATSRRLLQLASMTVEPGMSAVAEHALDLAAERSNELQKLIDWDVEDEEEGGEKKVYDPLERDPSHSAALNGSKCCWESLPMAHHFCPGVADKSGICKTARETVEFNSFTKALAGLCINVEDQNEEEGQVALPCVLRYYNDPVVVALREERKKASERNREDYGAIDENDDEEEEFFESAANEELGDDLQEGGESDGEDDALAAALAEEGSDDDLGDFDEDDEDEEDAAAFAAMDGIGEEEETEEEEEEEARPSKNPRKRLRELMSGGGTFVSADEVADLIAEDNKKSRSSRHH